MIKKINYQTKKNLNQIIIFISFVTQLMKIL